MSKKAASARELKRTYAYTQSLTTTTQKLHNTHNRLHIEHSQYVMCHPDDMHDLIHTT